MCWVRTTTVFWAGDLNYRIDGEFHDVIAKCVSMDVVAPARPRSAPQGNESRPCFSAVCRVDAEVHSHLPLLAGYGSDQTPRVRRCGSFVCLRGVTASSTRAWGIQ